MASRTCDLAGCETSLEGMHVARRFCSDAHRKQSKHSPAVVARDPGAPVETGVADALRAELEALDVAGTYEGRVALGIAAQLDRGVVAGAAYASLSKELDRRVDALRLKADLPDNPVAVIGASVEGKRSHLRSA